MKYYLHDTSAFEDEKVAELFMNFGYEGVGLFYVTLEKIGKQEKPVKTSVLKSQLKVRKRLEKCWKFMEQIGLISSNNGESFNKQLLNFSEKYQIKKEKTREKVAEWREKQRDAESVTDYVPICNPLKVKESKVKESKVKEKKEKKEDIAEAKSASAYTLCMDVYNSWCLETLQVTAKIDGAEGNALKSIIKWLEKNVKEQPATPNVTANALKFILINKDKWEPFHQQQVKLVQINSNLINIINAIKNENKSVTSADFAASLERLQKAGLM